MWGCRLPPRGPAPGAEQRRRRPRRPGPRGGRRSVGRGGGRSCRVRDRRPWALGAPGSGVGEVSQREMGSFRCLFLSVFSGSTVGFPATPARGRGSGAGHVLGCAQVPWAPLRTAQGPAEGERGSGSLGLSESQTGLLGHLSHCRSWGKAQPREAPPPGQRLGGFASQG